MKHLFDNSFCLRKRLWRVIAVAVLAVVACACATEGIKAKHLTEAEVIAIADRAAVKCGYSLDKFTKYATFNAVEKDNTWIVVYNLKPDAHGMVPVGGDFTVGVDDKTRKALLIPGR